MRRDRIEAILAAVEGRDILNLGCVGHTIPFTEKEKERWLHYRLCASFPDANVVGLDLDQPNVKCMRQMGFNAEIGDAQDLAYVSKFDTVILGELIEHLQNPGACLVGCAKVLKPGGRIVISTPNAFSVMLGLMYLKDFDKAFNSEHVVWFCPQTLRALLERCGLRLKQLSFVDDLAPDIDPVLLYRVFAYSWLSIRWLLPERYRNTMVAVCEPMLSDQIGSPAVSTVSTTRLTESCELAEQGALPSSDVVIARRSRSCARKDTGDPRRTPSDGERP